MLSQESIKFQKSIEKLAIKIMDLGQEGYSGKEERKNKIKKSVTMVNKFLYKEFDKYVEWGVGYDGEHHKQWCLYQMANKLGFDLEDCDEGIAP